MTHLERISGAALRQRLTGRELSSIDKTEKPQLHWISISCLRVDQRYQRRINSRASEKNILHIAEHFTWSKFSPVVVADVEGEDGIFAIIDGQHRTTAAALRQIREVPCLIMRASLAEQASAFAAINGAVTAVSTMQMHHARVAAGDAEAVALHEACTAAGVTICRYPIPASDMKAGDTLAAARLQRQLGRFGRDTFILALSCITRTRDGNVGMVRAPVVDALCTALDAEPAWMTDPDELIAAMQSFDFFEAYRDAQMRAAKDGGGVAASFAEIVAAHLAGAMGGNADC